MRRGNDVAEGIDALRAILATRSTEEILGRGLHEFIDFLQCCFIDITDRLAAAFFGAAPAPSAVAEGVAAAATLADSAQMSC